jgi:signal transduction histidine kinase
MPPRPSRSAARPVGRCGPIADGEGRLADARVRVRTAMDTSATIDGARRRSAEQAAGARLSQKALRDTSLAEFLDDATFTLADTLGVEDCTVFLFDEDETDKLLLVAAYGDLARAAGTMRIDSVGSVGGLALARREPVVCYASDDRSRFPASGPLFDAGLESTMVVAIEGPEHAFGVLAAHCRGRRQFTRDDELFLQTVANVVGGAILRDRAELALVEAEEAERRRIAEAVHDDTLQVMIAVALRLETLEREMVDPAMRDKIHELVGDTRSAATRLRSLAFDLFPEDLNSGLESAVRRKLAKTAQEGGFRYDLDVDLPRMPPKAAARTIYRNTQEALVNIRKHAQAAHVRVSIGSDGDGTAVRIVDDGVGISVRAADSGMRGHLGIRGLRERTVRAGGTVDIHPGSEGGTVVAFWVPNASRRR